MTDTPRQAQARVDAARAALREVEQVRDEAQARVDAARAALRDVERGRDEAFVVWWNRESDTAGRTHGVVARLAAEAGIPDRHESVRQAVKRGRKRARS